MVEKVENYDKNLEGQSVKVENKNGAEVFSGYVVEVVDGADDRNHVMLNKDVEEVHKEDPSWDFKFVEGEFANTQDLVYLGDGSWSSPEDVSHNENCTLYKT